MGRPSPDFARVRELSPRRNTTRSAAIPESVDVHRRYAASRPRMQQMLSS